MGASTTLEVRGQPLKVALRPGTGIPLLLMNGLGANLELLQPFVDALDQDIPVVRFDVPGVGGSPAPRMPYRLRWLALLVRAMLDQFGCASVDVLGLSWGGALAQQFAIQHRSRCRRLVLVSTSAGAVSVPGRLKVLSKLVTPRRYTDPAYRAGIAAEIYGGPIEADVHAGFQHAVRSGGRRGYYYQMLAGVGWTSLPWLLSLRHRALVIGGDDDPLVPVQNARWLHRWMRNSRLHVYHGGHLGLVTQADELAPLIGRFLRAE